MKEVGSRDKVSVALEKGIRGKRLNAMSSKQCDASLHRGIVVLLYKCNV